jgi:ElaB/YqjD/DUF883 family membrane-anchored ribosome-binding protein
MGEEPSRIREEIEQTRDRMGETVDALSDKANVRKRVKENVADKRDRLKAQMQTTASQVGGATPDAADVKDGAKRAVGVAEENPLGLAIGGLAAGFLIGMAVPSTKVEDERIGPTADRIKDQARESGQEAIERGKNVAHAAADAVGESAETLRDSAGEAITEAKDKVQESAQQEAQEMRTRA